MKAFLLCAAAFPIIAACATGPETSTTSNPSAYEEREMRTTGSNVARRSRAAEDAAATTPAAAPTK